MFSFKKYSLDFPSPSKLFHSDDGSDRKPAVEPRRKYSSESNFGGANHDTNPFSSAQVLHVNSSGGRNNCKNDFHEGGGQESQSVQQLENYVACKSEETTKTARGCVRIAEGIKGDATATLATLHLQGEQITRTHNVAVGMDQDLSRGEKILGSLGGLFSKTWKPKKTRSITGPVTSRDDLAERRRGSSHPEPMSMTSGLHRPVKGLAITRAPPPPEPASGALHKVEIEKSKQDDALSDLSNILGELKGMAIDMGSEIDRQVNAMDNLQDDVGELSFRVKGANQRARRLLRK